MKVLLLTRYGRLGVTSRIRFLQYAPYLEKHGVEITVAPFLTDDYVQSLYKGQKNVKAVALAYIRRLRQLLGSGDYDLLWIEKELLPWLPAIPERIVGPYVVDYDDAVFHGYDQHRSFLVRFLLGNKIRTTMSRATVVVVGNEYLASYARESGASDIEHVPTVVDLDRYGVPREHSNEVFTIGWIGTPWTSRYLPAIAPALKEVCRDGRARLLLIGSGDISLDGVPLEVRAWSEPTEIENIQSIDVGIMPLPDEPYERGKCGYKLLQYMACGRPVIASPVGANRQIVDDGVNGLFASTPADWIRAIEKLRQNQDMRRAMGEAARLKVDGMYSLQVQAPRILAILEKARRVSQLKSP
jgi:glycosyltransferase involved in cell wall biosynthesis